MTAISKITCKLAKQVSNLSKIGKSNLNKTRKFPNKSIRTMKSDILDIIKPKKVILENLNHPSLMSGFKEIQPLKGKEFVEAAYSKLVKHLNMEDIAPELIYGKRKDLDGLAAFSRLEGKIYIDPDRIRNKADTINSLVHELKHADQFNIIARYKKGTGLSPAQVLCSDYKEQKLLNRDYYNKMIDRSGVIKGTDPEAKKAQNYYNALIGSAFNKSGDIMEKEAYKIGDQIEKIYLKQVEGLSGFKIFKRNWIDIFF
ncbi:MAG: hypothetical protein PHC34_07775 [Candidatus Gastranaerophilales bacterium]|nr:hypothetical protein [Candidatus Gastranaerophilales bacterium]